MNRFSALIFAACFLITGCYSNSSSKGVEQNIDVYGHWVIEKNGEVMLDPQPSGLKKWKDGLLTLSDRSAVPSQRLRLRKISPHTATLNGPDLLMSLSDNLKQSCFADYIGDNPDLEALAIDPNNDNVFYIVTEDASGARPMSELCQTQFSNSGATVYPRLLVRLELQSENSVVMTHVRPIRFTADMHVGDFPNDGIEALAFGKNNTLYLGIEKDENTNARIFSIQLDENFWMSDDFADVSALDLKLPKLTSGRHPINGMDYYQTDGGKEFLLAAARNDGNLWVVDLDGKKETRILPMTFYAEIKQGTGECKDFEKMHNASIEGVAVIENVLWMINDPWKKMYDRNIQCEENRENFENFSPLLFSLEIQQDWFK